MASGTATWSAEQVDALCTQLGSMGAVLFGAARDGGHTARAQADLAPCLARGAVLLVPCDAGAEEGAKCARAGIRLTPTLIAGGERVPGAALSEVAAVAEAPRGVARRLAARGAELFGRESCPWTRRQRVVLGAAAGAAGLPYVDCEDGGAGEARCAALGVQGVPAWLVQGLAAPLPGYRSLGELQALAVREAAALGAEAAAAERSGSGGGGGGGGGGRCQ
jgi:hypothetical protein